MPLIDTPNLVEHDDFYEAFLAAHKGLTPDQSRSLNLQMIMILANHIGDPEVLQQAIDLAKAS
jgi:hypothetical protein